MFRSFGIAGTALVTLIACGASASACGDKFLAPGRGPSMCAASKPPHKIAVLIYGAPTSAAVLAVSSPEYRKALKMVGYHVMTCTGGDECTRELKGQKFDVVLADAKDAEALKSEIGSAVVPVLLNASKDEVRQAKATYGQAFDAASGSVRLLPVINRVASQGGSR